MLKYLRIIPYLFHSIIFNFHYLPFRQAIRLPVILYKPHLLALKGKIIIDSPIKPGMIRLGIRIVPLYPNTGIVWDNEGLCIFKGRCTIGNASAISISKTGSVSFGDNFIANAQFRVTSFRAVKFHKNVLVGWNCLFSDTDFHYVVSVLDNTVNIPYGAIEIGENVWFGMNCCTFKSVNLPSNCIVGANSLLNSSTKCDSYSLISGTPAKLKKSGVYRSLEKDKTLKYIDDV